MGEQTKNMLIGAFIIIACSLFVSFILFLRPSVGDEKQALVFRFSDINNIGVGTRVLYAGRPVGEVVSIEEIPDSRKQPVDELGRVYIYQVTVKVDSSVLLYDTDEVTIQTSGLLGEKSIGIVPKAAAPGVIPKKITAKEPFYADSVDPLANAIVQITEVANEMERTFKLAADWLEENDQGMTNMVKNIDVITTNISEGKGTLGKLVNEDDLYVRFSGIMSKVDIILNDISHYGLLFSSNKKWQRTRLKRITQLNALDTPEGFRSYFEDEMDRINLSMSRLSMLLNQAEQSPDREEIMDSMRFKREFQDFKRDVDSLSENVKLFNQQLSEAAN
jgi:phospholipid/cholesterol/gamma-HCH transport system substrate-binding protein